MHAFLIVGRGEKLVLDKVTEVAKELKAKLIPYDIKKIDQVRELNKFTRLTVDEPTAIYIKDVNEAGEEALNAFLKNLEEPQENLYYILSAPNLSSVLPTIASRCQVIRIILPAGKAGNNESGIRNEEIEKFLKFSIGKKLAYVDSIRDRGVAIKFVEEFIASEHQMLHESANLKELSNNLQVGLTTLTNLKANGNVNLQLANFVIQLV